VVATFAQRLRVPAPSLLVIAGLIVGLLPGEPAVVVTPDIVSLVVLPPLLFAAGEELPRRDLRAVWRPKFSLSNRSADRCNRCNRCNNLTAAPSAVQRYQGIDNSDYRRSEGTFTRDIPQHCDHSPMDPC
jgi:hypothetical protein